jgi:hypothetical protein
MESAYLNKTPVWPFGRPASLRRPLAVDWIQATKQIGQCPDLLQYYDSPSPRAISLGTVVVSCLRLLLLRIQLASRPIPSRLASTARPPFGDPRKRISKNHSSICGRSLIQRTLLFVGTGCQPRSGLDMHLLFSPSQTRSVRTVSSELCPSRQPGH